MIERHIEISNLPQVDAHLARLSQGVEVLKPLWERFGKEFYSQEESLFNKAPWKPLSPAYAERKRQEFGSKSILRATDVLFTSLTRQGATGNIHRVDDMSAEFGSNDFKAMFHQFGTARMPARPPLAEPDIDRYDSLASVYLDEIIKKAGFN